MAVEYVKWNDPRVEYKDENEEKDITAVANVSRPLKMIEAIIC